MESSVFSNRIAEIDSTYKEIIEEIFPAVEYYLDNVRKYTSSLHEFADANKEYLDSLENSLSFFQHTDTSQFSLFGSHSKQQKLHQQQQRLLQVLYTDVIKKLDLSLNEAIYEIQQSRQIYSAGRNIATKNISQEEISESPLTSIEDYLESLRSDELRQAETRLFLRQSLNDLIALKCKLISNMADAQNLITDTLCDVYTSGAKILAENKKELKDDLNVTTTSKITNDGVGDSAIDKLIALGRKVSNKPQQQKVAPEFKGNILSRNQDLKSESRIQPVLPQPHPSLKLEAFIAKSTVNNLDDTEDCCCCCCSCYGDDIEPSRDCMPELPPAKGIFPLEKYRPFLMEDQRNQMRDGPAQIGGKSSLVNILRSLISDQMMESDSSFSRSTSKNESLGEPMFTPTPLQRSRQTMPTEKKTAKLSNENNRNFNKEDKLLKGMILFPQTGNGNFGNKENKETEFDGRMTRFFALSRLKKMLNMFNLAAPQTTQFENLPSAQAANSELTPISEVPSEQNICDAPCSQIEVFERCSINSMVSAAPSETGSDRDSAVRVQSKSQSPGPGSCMASGNRQKEETDEEADSISAASKLSDTHSEISSVFTSTKLDKLNTKRFNFLASMTSLECREKYAIPRAMNKDKDSCNAENQDIGKQHSTYKDANYVLEKNKKFQKQRRIEGPASFCMSFLWHPNYLQRSVESRAWSYQEARER